MKFTTLRTPVGELTLMATDQGLSGIYFENHQHPPQSELVPAQADDSAFESGKVWLYQYFKEKKRGPLPTLDLSQGTDFQRRVWDALGEIADGETTTYADIAKQIGSPKGVRAVGAAVGKNPVSIVLPCHRVLGSDGSLTGFAGGLERKQWLLVHEGILVL